MNPFDVLSTTHTSADLKCPAVLNSEQFSPSLFLEGGEDRSSKETLADTLGFENQSAKTTHLYLLTALISTFKAIWY